jgi:hypothetical protein
MSLATPGSGLTETFGPLKASVILHELHQTAQPLTVLLGLQYRGVIQRAVEESRRVSSGFDQMRKLVANSSPKTQCVSQTPEPQRIECVHV